jgi:anti-sigma regulatory factor (Ser/Thr protein kinase)
VNTQRTFPNAPASVSAARRYVLDAIGVQPDLVSEATAIVVSELATNCVRHAGTAFTVGVETTPSRLRVEVTDTGGGVPTVRSPDASELSGRGLRLVRELSDEWGVTAADADGGKGKSVWFTLRLAATGRRLQDAD